MPIYQLGALFVILGLGAYTCFTWVYKKTVSDCVKKYDDL